VQMDLLSFEDLANPAVLIALQAVLGQEVSA
jgi:hypothetical protein